MINKILFSKLLLIKIPKPQFYPQKITLEISPDQSRTDHIKRSYN